MKTLLLTFLLTSAFTIACAQTPQYIRLTQGDADLATAKARMQHMHAQMAIFSTETALDRGTYKFLNDLGLLSHLYVSRADGTNDCFVFYFDRERQSPAEIQEDLLLLKKFVYPSAAPHDITTLQTEPMQM